ncbi:hypothetical protein BDZ91DRAFT_726560 [Kalaharituber pfeilii]|nr:hypothetical protein BDZ91DRAFT_726560 [Kalaharituber pfeilii]
MILELWTRRDGPLKENLYAKCITLVWLGREHLMEPFRVLRWFCVSIKRNPWRMVLVRRREVSQVLGGSWTEPANADRQVYL